jgi:hypothetical protein
VKSYRLRRVIVFERSRLSPRTFFVTSTLLMGAICGVDLFVTMWTYPVSVDS